MKCLQMLLIYSAWISSLITYHLITCLFCKLRPYYWNFLGSPAPSHYCTEKQKANSTRLWSDMLSIAPNLIRLAVIWSHSGPILSKRKKSKEAFSLFNCSHTQCFDVLMMVNWRKQHRTNWDVSNQLKASFWKLYLWSCTISKGINIRYTLCTFGLAGQDAVFQM